MWQPQLPLPPQRCYRVDGHPPPRPAPYPLRRCLPWRAGRRTPARTRRGPAPPPARAFGVCSADQVSPSPPWLMSSLQDTCVRHVLRMHDKHACGGLHARDGMAHTQAAKVRHGVDAVLHICVPSTIMLERRKRRHFSLYPGRCRSQKTGHKPHQGLLGERALSLSDWQPHDRRWLGECLASPPAPHQKWRPLRCAAQQARPRCCYTCDALRRPPQAFRTASPRRTRLAPRRLGWAAAGHARLTRAAVGMCRCRRSAKAGDAVRRGWSRSRRSG